LGVQSSVSFADSSFAKGAFKSGPPRPLRGSRRLGGELKAPFNKEGGGGTPPGDCLDHPVRLRLPPLHRGELF